MDIVSAKVLLNEYGERVRVRKYGSDKVEVTKALIQPFRFKDNKNMYGNYMEIGVENDGTFLYIGKPDVRLDMYPFDSRIDTDKDSYVLKNAEKICIGNEIVYIRAILRKCSQR